MSRFSLMPFWGTDGIGIKLSEPTNVRLATIAGARG